MFHYLNRFVKDAVKEEKSLYFSRKQGYLIIGEKMLRKCLEYSENFQRYNPSVIYLNNRTFEKKIEQFKIHMIWIWYGYNEDIFIIYNNLGQT